MRQSKYCNCKVSSNKEILKLDIDYSFCDKCGCVLLKDAGRNICYTLKSKQKIYPSDLSPINIIKNMKKKTEENTPFIFQDYNINKADKYIIEKTLKSIQIYLKHRKFLMLNLQKLIKAFDYCDMIFYQCLFYLDTYLSHHMTEDISEKKLLYYLIGFFLCSSKFKETDSYEIPFDTFFDFSKGIYLTSEKIAYYEVVCLKNINYNVFVYSAYDWILQLISNGIVFNCEIDKDKEIILIKGHRHSVLNAINKYCIKLLLSLTIKNMFFKYAPMYIAFSLIQISREKYLDKALIKSKLFFELVNIYGITPGDYMKCYEEIKEEIHLENHKIPKGKESSNLNNINVNDIYEELKVAEKTGNLEIFSEKNKYDNLPNKFRSSNTLLQVKDNLIINNDNIKEKGSPNEEKESEFILNEVKKKKRKKTKKSIPIPNKKQTERFSIDCKNENLFKSNDNLPYINNNYKERNEFFTINEDKMGLTRSTNFSLNKKTNGPELKDLKYVRSNLKRFNSIESKNNNTNKNIVSTPIGIERDKAKKKTKKKSKFFSNKNLDYNNKNDFEIDSNKNKKITSKVLPRITGFEEFNLDKNNNNNAESNITNNINKNKKHYKLKGVTNNLKIKVSLPEDEIKPNKDSNKRIQVF